MLTAYDQALSLELPEAPGEPVLIPLEWREEGALRVALRTLWEPSPREVHFNLNLPLVEPIRFDWDQELFGHVLRFPGRSYRFCHPLLRSQPAELLAKSELVDRRFQFGQIRDWNWEWWSFYDRVAQALAEGIASLQLSSRSLTTGLVRSQLQRRISELVNGALGQSGLPLTDDLDHAEHPIKLLRQMYELELGYPDILGDNLLWEELKLKYLEHVDAFADILHTGKHDVGRHVMRVHPEESRNFRTGRPVPSFAQWINPFTPWANPVRVYRENRGIVDCLPFQEPIRPPIRVQGAQLPLGVVERLTTLTVLIADFENWNIHVADEATAEEFGLVTQQRLVDGQVQTKRSINPGDIACLDGMLVTPTGQEKLRAYQTKSELLPAEKFFERKERLERLPGFRYEEEAELVEVLGTGQGLPVFRHQFRYWFEQPLPVGRDKVKIACGGLKGVTRPCPQLWVKLGEAVVPVDLIIAERALLSKGGRDAVWYPLAALAGVTELDPDWSLPELLRRIEAGLEGNGLPATGRVPVLRKKRVPVKRHLMANVSDELLQQMQEAFGEIEIEYEETDELEAWGEGIAGPLPVMRAPETEARQSSEMASVAVNMQVRNTVGMDFPYFDGDRELIEKIGTFVYKHGDYLRE